MELLGQGSYAKIYKLSDKYAIKIYKNDLDQGIAQDMLREIFVLKSISSAYIIPIVEVTFDSIILPFYQYTLAQYLKIGKVNIKNFFHSICSGIHMLHSYGIAHRDLKPSNILVENSNKGVLIDMGFSKILDNNNTPKVVTSWYRPPEVFDEQVYNLEIDVWGAGCILAELCMEEHIFNFEKDFDILNHQCYLMGTPQNYFKNIMVKNHYGIYKTRFGHFKCYDLIIGMLKINHLERFTITQCLNSKYFNKHKVMNNRIIYTNYLQDFNLNIKLQDFNLNIKLQHDILPLREILVLWMLEVCNSNLLSDSTYFRSIVLLDKFIVLNKKIKIERNNFQLIGMCCLWIASKIEATNFIAKEQLIYMSDNTFTKDNMLSMEKSILSELNFNLNTPLLCNYISMYSNMLKLIPEQIKNFNLYIHICTIFPEHYDYSFSDLAYICANLTLQEDFELSDDLIECKNEISKWIKHDFDSINEKFQ